MRLQQQRELRSHQSELATIGHADILVGIPCFNNEQSIAHVVQAVSAGLAQHAPDRRSVLLVIDGGSTDATRERAAIALPRQQAQMVTRYQGIGGKGSALRTLFAAAVQLQAPACVTVDADLRSITPAWMGHFLEPLESGYEFVGPLYARYKYDGTITNNLVYCLTRALYGQQLRQPIGGDFGFSQRLARYYLEQPVWQTDVARFGIDIWMTLGAIVQLTQSTDAARQPRLCQVNLGVKLHDAKDPASALGPMFEQVCGTLFTQIERDVGFWQPIQGSHPVPTFGLQQMPAPDPIAVNQAQMVQAFRQGMRTYGDLYRLVCSEPTFQALQQASTSPAASLQIAPYQWARLLYEFLTTYHWLGSQRSGLIRALTPLYLGQVAAFINQTCHLDHQGAEAAIEALAQHCEQEKPYLRQRWRQSPSQQHLSRLHQVLSASP